MSLAATLTPERAPRPVTNASGPVLYCGDPHGRFSHLVQAAQDLRASAVVLLGDMEPGEPLHVALAPILDRVWWIPGNHDADSDVLWRRVWGSALAHRNLHGRVVSLPDGTRLAGLGGVFRQVVWYPAGGDSRNGVPAFRSPVEHANATPKQDRWGGTGPHRKHWGTIYPDVFDLLSDQEADVLVTHEAPGYHPHGFELLDTLAQAMGVRAVVHGHHHDALDSSARWLAQGFKSYGVGLRGVTALDRDGVATVIRPGDKDEERAHRPVIA
jgi:predicted phosphodiesterase